MGSGSESEGLHIASYAPSPRLPQDRLFSLSPRTGLCMAGGTLLTLAGSLVKFFHQGRAGHAGGGRVARGGPLARERKVD